MPTSRPRHLVTESERAAALEAASSHWPGLSRSQLLARLALEGARAVTAAADERRARRLQAVRRNSGLLTEVYPPDDLRSLREEWLA